jgi:hypothetical protein
MQLQLCAIYHLDEGREEVIHHQVIVAWLLSQIGLVYKTVELWLHKEGEIDLIVRKIAIVWIRDERIVVKRLVESFIKDVLFDIITDDLLKC